VTAVAGILADTLSTAASMLTVRMWPLKPAARALEETHRYAAVSFRFYMFKIPRESHCWAVRESYNMFTSGNTVKALMWFIYLPLTVTTLTFYNTKTACLLFCTKYTCFPELDLDLRQPTPDLIVLGSDSNMRRRQDKSWLSIADGFPLMSETTSHPYHHLLLYAPWHKSPWRLSLWN
jgi:hypothetical protein